MTPEETAIHVRPPPQFSRWWGDFSIDENQAAAWQIGPLKLWLRHGQSEWSLCTETKADPMTAESRIQIPYLGTLPDSETHQRFAIQQKKSAVQVSPLTADRPMISRPLSPFAITAKERVTLFISTPIWIRIAVGSPARTLVDIPSYRPSDSWFGPDTTQGELCYASRMHAQMNTENISWTPHRAITTVELINPTNASILLERLCLPLPHFSIFSSQENLLWTEGATFELTGEDGLAHLRIHRSPPREAGRVKLETPPRDPRQENIVFRAISALFPSGGSFL